MIRRIVVPLDGTAFGEYAIPWAVAIARQARATIELVHVHVPHQHDHMSSITPFAYEHAPDYDLVDDDEELDAEMQWLIRRAQELRAETGLPILARTVRGRVGEALCEECAALAADLVVMATHARGGFERVRLGSVGDTIVRQVSAPVLLIRPPDAEATPPTKPAFRRILVPLDGSAFSEQVLPHVRELARSTGAQPWLLHVVSPNLGASRRGSRNEEGTIEKRFRAGESYLEGVAAALGETTEPVLTTTLVDRLPAAAIKEAASDAQVDMIAIATHGRGGISRLLLGSTGDEVVRNAGKPVLLYRPRVSDELRDVFDVYGESGSIETVV